MVERLRVSELASLNISKWPSEKIIGEVSSNFIGLTSIPLHGVAQLMNPLNGFISLIPNEGESSSRGQDPMNFNECIREREPMKCLSHEDDIGAHIAKGNRTVTPVDYVNSPSKPSKLLPHRRGRFDGYQLAKERNDLTAKDASPRSKIDCNGSSVQVECVLEIVECYQRVVRTTAGVQRALLKSRSPKVSPILQLKAPSKNRTASPSP